jgi:hypothetical protein
MSLVKPLVNLKIETSNLSHSKYFIPPNAVYQTALGGIFLSLSIPHKISVSSARASVPAPF